MSVLEYSAASTVWSPEKKNLGNRVNYSEYFIPETLQGSPPVSACGARTKYQVLKYCEDLQPNPNPNPSPRLLNLLDLLTIWERESSGL